MSSSIPVQLFLIGSLMTSSGGCASMGSPIHSELSEVELNERVHQHFEVGMRSHDVAAKLRELDLDYTFETIEDRPCPDSGPRCFVARIYEGGPRSVIQYQHRARLCLWLDGHDGLACVAYEEFFKGNAMRRILP